MPSFPIERDSFTSLEVFRDSIPLYHGRFITGTIEQPEQTGEQRFGVALHTRLLQPEKWAERVVVHEKVDRRTKGGKFAWANVQEILQEKRDAGIRAIAVSYEECEAINLMAEAVLANPACSHLLELDSRCKEKRIDFDFMDMKFKCYLDVLDVDMIWDIKTTSSVKPNDFSKQVANGGLHRQAALYIIACRHGIGITAEQHRLLAITTEPPYESVVVSLTPDAILLGERQLIASINELKMCKENNVWTPRHSGEVVNVSLPKYAFYED